MTTTKLPTGALLRVDRTRTWARVEIDRDQLVDRLAHHGGPWKVSDHVQAATAAADIAGIEALRIRGSRATFVSGSGHHRRALYVPTEHTAQAMQAMTAAELTGDVSALLELAAVLRPPFDRWLDPAAGPQILLQGRDFVCAPRSAGMAVRWAARARGVRARARVMRGAIFINPAPLPPGPNRKASRT